MKRVTGIGGIFFKCADQEATLAWYRNHLGIDSADWGGFAFLWPAADRPDEAGYTVWSAFKPDSTHMSPSTADFMINYRVDDLEALMAALKDEGVEVVGELEEHPNGKFAWVRDLDGRKVELWEPVPAEDDPYI